MIGDEDTVLGFALTGVEGRAVSNSEEAEAALDGALENKQNGIIMITERTAELVRERVDRFIFTRSFPLVVEIPDRLGPVSGRPKLREMANQAIGIKL